MLHGATKRKKKCSVLKQVCEILIQSKTSFFTYESLERHYDIAVKSGLNPGSASYVTLIKCPSVSPQGDWNNNSSTYHGGLLREINE